MVLVHVVQTHVEVKLQNQGVGSCALCSTFHSSALIFHPLGFYDILAFTSNTFPQDIKTNIKLIKIHVV